MQGITQAFTTPARPTALDMIGERRERERAAELAEYNAMTDRGTMMEKMAAGQAERATEAQTALAFEQLPPVTAEVGTKEWVKQIQEQLRAAQNSGNPDLQKWAITGYAQLDQVAQGAPIDPGNLRGAKAKAQIENWEEEAGAFRRTGAEKDEYDTRGGPSKVDLVWAQAILEDPGLDPNTKGLSAIINKNWSADKKAELAATLAEVLDQIKKQYIRDYGVPMDTIEAQKQALATVFPKLKTNTTGYHGGGRQGAKGGRNRADTVTPPATGGGSRFKYKE